MLAVDLDLPCKRVSAVEPEMCDRDDMHLLGIVKAQIKNARDAAFVAQVPNLRYTTLMRKTLLRTFELSCKVLRNPLVANARMGNAARIFSTSTADCSTSSITVRSPGSPSSA